MIRLIKNLCQGSKAYVKIDEKGEIFEIEREMKQGDPLSPSLFNSVLKNIFQKLGWEGRSIRINGESLSYLRFADDVVLILADVEELEWMGNELRTRNKYEKNSDTFKRARKGGKIREDKIS